MSSAVDNMVYFVMPEDTASVPGNPTGPLKQLVETCGLTVECLIGFDALPTDLDNSQLLFVEVRPTCNVSQMMQCCTRPGRWVFYNVLPDQVDELTLLMAGAEGVFFADDKPELLLKGIHRLAKYDVWFKRETINKAFRQLRDKNDAAARFKTIEAQQLVQDAGLTKRERNILLLVSKGAQNQEIADTLHISVNTVKTHLYSIFRKTNSRNRVELVSWSSNVFN